MSKGNTGITSDRVTTSKATLAHNRTARAERAWIVQSKRQDTPRTSHFLNDAVPGQDTQL